MTDKEKLIQTWIQFQRTQSPDLEWANDDFIDLANEDPETAWECIVGVTELEASDDIVAGLAEGPMEDLLAEHGTKFIGRIEDILSNNLVFARLIKQVWIDEMPVGVKSKIGALQKKYGSVV